MSEDIIVRMGELVVTKDPNVVLVALGLGSCIGLCGYDPVAHVAGMAHIVLPEAVGKADESTPAKSADIAVPTFLKTMEEAGARRSRIKIAFAGGAQLFQFRGAETRLDIGNRNTEAVARLLASVSMKEVASDVGGSTGRTVKLYVVDGTVTVRQAGKPEEVLATIANARSAAAA